MTFNDLGRGVIEAGQQAVEIAKRQQEEPVLSFAGLEIDYAATRAVSYAFPREADWRGADQSELTEAAE